jgi:hypothetical protein
MSSVLARLRDRLLLQEDLNFLLTNRVPRHALTLFMGRFSKIRNPWVCRASIAVWRMFAELDLSDARKQRFDSLHDCFTRELRPGARNVDPDPRVLASPCDGIVGPCGTVEQGSVLQAKGFPYRMADLFGRAERAAPFEGGTYVTLRLTSSMYHRFHAPARRHRRTRQLHRRRHLERESDRARARAAPVLPQRTRSDPDAPDGWNPACPGAGGRHSGGQHPAALPGCAAAHPLARPERDALQRPGHQG